MKQDFKKIVQVLNNYRLYSQNYLNMSYFLVFSFVILKYSEYVVLNQITPNKIIALLLPFTVLLFVPLGGLYYIVKTGFCIYQISKKNNFEKKNKFIFISDIIYIVTIIYVHLSSNLHR